MRKSWIIVIIILVLVSGGIYLLMASRKIPSLLVKKTEGPSLGEQIYEQTKNPLEDKLPEANPFAVETNPVKKAYPNPFD